jgi:hypothetical protein
MDFLELADKYGVLIAGGLWLIYRAWHFFAERYFPQRVKEREETARAERVARDEAARAVREAEATLLKARIDGEERDREWRRRIEERTVSTLESISQNISALVLSHTQHVNFSFGAHVEIKDRLDDLQESIHNRQKLEELEKKLVDTQEKIKAGNVQVKRDGGK